MEPQMKRKLSPVVSSPSLAMMLYEARWIHELVQCLASAEHPAVDGKPRGDNRPILVVPGFLCNDTATWVLRRFLRQSGFRVYRWKQGINWGPRPGVRVRLLHRIQEIRARTGQTVTLVGWSLGGIYAREVACTRPDLVREVITLGSPWHGEADKTAVWKAFGWFNRKHCVGMSASIDDLEPSTPCMFIYTRGDGIVPWEFCVPGRGRRGRSVEVVGSHIGLVANAQVLHLLNNHLLDGPTRLFSHARARQEMGPALPREPRHERAGRTLRSSQAVLSRPVTG